MPRPKTRIEIVDRIGTIVKDDPKRSAQKILYRLESWAKQMGFDLPNSRTVLRLKKEILGKTEAEQMLYKSCHWPECCMSGALPWEASRTMLDLLSHFRDRGFNRPTIRISQWFWRISLAAPDLNIGKRFDLANRCGLWDLIPAKREEGFLGLESYFLLSPWRSKAMQARYDKLIHSKEVPGLPECPHPGDFPRTPAMEHIAKETISQFIGGRSQVFERLEKRMMSVAKKIAPKLGKKVKDVTLNDIEQFEIKANKTQKGKKQ
jgi:hypothetical protein